MKHETKIATVENVVTAICFGVGALLVVLALYTLLAVKPVYARHVSMESLTGPADGYRLADDAAMRPGLSAGLPPVGRRVIAALRQA